MDSSPQDAGVVRREHAAWRWLLPLALFAFGFWLLPWSLTCGLGCYPGDYGDARFNGVVLEHFFRWATGHDRSLISPPFFYPMPGVSTFSDNHWGTAWLYSIFRAFGWDRYEAFDLWFMAGFAANFAACHYVLRKQRFSTLASAVGAFLFTFAMPVIAKYGHAQLICRALAPLGLLYWQTFRETGGWRWLGWLALSVVGQFYISIYIGYFTVLVIGSWALAQWAVEGWGPRQWFAQWGSWNQPESRRELLLASTTIVIALLLLVGLMHPYLHYSKLYGFRRSLVETASMLPRPQSYLLADGSSIWKSLSQKIGGDVPMRPEHQIFFGAGALGLALIAMVFSMRRQRWVALGAILLVVALTLSIGGHSLYLLFAKLPGADSIRAVSRIGLVLALPLAFLVAMGVDAALEPGKRKRLWALILIPLLLGESVSVAEPSTQIDASRERIVRLATKLPSALPEGAIIFNPIRDGEAVWESEIDGVIIAQDTGHPTLNGYSGNLPPGYDPVAAEDPCEQAEARVQAAKLFYEQKLKRPTPKGMSAPLVIAGTPVCSSSVWAPMFDGDLGRIGMKFESIRRVADHYDVAILITNDSPRALRTAVDGSRPFFVSWQVVPVGKAIDNDRWKARIPVGGKAIMPGETREVSFEVPVNSGITGQITVSGVIEGQAWMHFHRFVPPMQALPRDE